METGQLSMDVINAARRVVDSAHQRPASNLDFSPESLPIVEGMLAEAATFAAGLSASTKEQLGQSFGCYILEVGRRQFGGRYFWHDQYDAPSWLSENRRFTLPWCPGHALRSGSKATPRTTSRSSTMALPNGQRRGARGTGHFHLEGGHEYSHFLGRWENFQVGLCHPPDPWGDGHISSSIALAMKVSFGHTAHSQCYPGGLWRDMTDHAICGFEAPTPYERARIRDFPGWSSSDYGTRITVSTLCCCSPRSVRRRTSGI